MICFFGREIGILLDGILRAYLYIIVLQWRPTVSPHESKVFTSPTETGQKNQMFLNARRREGQAFFCPRDRFPTDSSHGTPSFIAIVSQRLGSPIYQLCLLVWNVSWYFCLTASAYRCWSACANIRVGSRVSGDLVISLCEVLEPH